METPAEVIARLPTKRVAADVLFVDADGRLLVVRPSYKQTWDLPGGVAEIGESPRAAARREVGEELGLDDEPGDLLAVDWVPPTEGISEVLAFVFDGGTIARPVASFDLPADEILEARWVTPEEARDLLDAEAHGRILRAIEARSHRSTVYLEDGRGPRT